MIGCVAHVEMILLHFTQLGVTVAAHDHAIVCVRPARDMVEFEASWVTFSADDAGFARPSRG
jgi:hypothetical protein